MQTLSNLDNFQNVTPIDTLIHMGAGRCSELEEYLTLHPKQLFLIEANAHLAEDLRKRIQSFEFAQVSCAAIAGTPGPATFYRYNLPEVSSLHPASRLMDLFPGLKLVDQQQLKTVSPASLVKPLQLQVEKENLLVIDLPGEELPVLKALQQEQQLELFNHIHLYCWREALYEGSEPAVRVLEWLQEMGFDLVAEDESRDTDRPCWNFRRNAFQLHYRNLQLKYEKLAAKNKELIDHLVDLEDHIKRISKERDEHSKMVVDLKAQVQILTKNSDAQSKITKDLDARVEEFTTFVTKLQEQLDQANQAGSGQKKLADERQQQINHLTQTKASLEKLADERAKQLDQVRQAKEEQVKLAKTRQTEIDRLKLSFEKAQAHSAQLEGQLAEMDARQRVMNEEMIRAEGQIDLIKDVLLREQGL